jgi:hypothetical protein
MSDSNDEHSSSDSSGLLLHRRRVHWPARQRDLQEESDRMLAAFLPVSSSLDKRTADISSQMHSRSPEHLFQSNTKSYAFQRYINNPKIVTPLDGAAAFPANLERLIREFCSREKTRNLPCARGLSSRVSKSGAAFRYEDTRTGVALETSAYKYGHQHFLTVVYGRDEPAIVNYIPGAMGENSFRKLYSVWNGTSGWETVPSVVKIFGEGDSRISSIQTTPIDTNPLPAITSSRSALGSGKRRAGREAELKIRLSLKHKRDEYEWEEESEEDGSGRFYFVSFHDMSSLPRMQVFRLRHKLADHPIQRDLGSSSVSECYMTQRW